MESNPIYANVLPETPRERVQFSRREWLALLGAAVCGAGYAFGHNSIFVTGNEHMPGIGLALSVWLILGLCMAITGTKHLRQSLFPLISALLLSATYGIFADEALRLMNLPVLVGLTATAAYALAGGRNLLTAAGLMESLRRFTSETLRHLVTPFLALFDLRHEGGDNSRTKALLLGIAICVPVVGLAGMLLCSADAAFGDAIYRLIRHIQTPNLSTSVWNLFRFGMLTLAIFSFVYGLTRWTAPETAKHRIRLRPLTLSVVLAALCVLYAAFLCIHIGELHAAPASYARSARAGFFQLVQVAFLTMLVTLPALAIHPDSPAIRVLGALATLLTMGIVASAIWRMALYIRAYGWTLLRMVTLWGILAITAAMFAALVKCVRPGVRVCRTLAVFAIVTWILFNYANVDARIAELNIAAHRRGSLEVLDPDYIAHLSPDALPALRELAAIEPEYDAALDYAETLHRCDIPGWYDWSLSWMKTRR